jgi:hypothetical protein
MQQAVTSKFSASERYPFRAMLRVDELLIEFPRQTTHGELTMPAKSKAQQKAAGAALAAKRGEEKVSNLKGASKSMYKSMSESQLDEFASTKRKGKPEHVAKSK